MQSEYEIEVKDSPRLHEKDLPDTEFEGEKYSFSPVNIPICGSHTKGGTGGQFTDNHDGTVSCKFCPFGARLGGYYRILDERIVDLRTL